MTSSSSSSSFSLLTQFPLVLIIVLLLLYTFLQFRSASRLLITTRNKKTSLMEELVINTADSSSVVLVDEDPNFDLISPTFGSVPNLDSPYSNSFANFTPDFPFPTMSNAPPFPFVPTLPTTLMFLSPVSKILTLLCPELEGRESGNNLVQYSSQVILLPY